MATVSFLTLANMPSFEMSEPVSRFARMVPRSGGPDTPGSGYAVERASSPGAVSRSPSFLVIACSAEMNCRWRGCSRAFRAAGASRPAGRRRDQEGGPGRGAVTTAPLIPTRALPPPRWGHDSRRVVNRCACAQSSLAPVMVTTLVAPTRPDFSATSYWGNERRTVVACAPSGELGSASTAFSNHCFAPSMSPRLSDTSPSLNSGLTQPRSRAWALRYHSAA